MATEGPPLVLLDTNVFVSAVKNASRATATFRLIVRLLESNIGLVGNEVLARGYLQYAEVFPSPTATALASAVLERMELVLVEDRFLLACAPYFPPGQAADCVHAATCLQTGAVLVSNDRHFRAVSEAGVVEVLATSETIRRWPPSHRASRISR